MNLPRPEWRVGAVALDLINMFIARCTAVFVQVAGLVLILLLLSGIVIT